MNVKKTKVTEITEISDIETDEAVTEAEFEECNSDDYDAAADEYDEFYGECSPTPLQHGYHAWIKRKQREKVYGRDSTEELNLIEELVYGCLQYAAKSYQKILRA